RDAGVVRAARAGGNAARDRRCAGGRDGARDARRRVPQTPAGARRRRGGQHARGVREDASRGHRALRRGGANLGCEARMKKKQALIIALAVVALIGGAGVFGYLVLNTFSYTGAEAVTQMNDEERRLLER